MAFDAGAVYGQAIFDDKQWTKGVDNVNRSNKSMTKSIFTANAAYDLLKKGVSLVTEQIKDGINKAVEYGETVNKFKVVFGDGTKTIESASNAFKDLTSNYGLSNNAALEMLSSTGDLLTGLGFSQEQALGFSEQVQKLSVDLASFQNYAGGAKGASEALTKALLGETESAKGLGIVIRQGTKEFNDQVKALVETQGLTEMQAKAQLILKQAMEQSKNAIGDYARTSQSLANMQREIGAQTDNLKISLGQFFLPIVRDITAAMLDSTKATNKFLESQENITRIQEIIGKARGSFQVFKETITDIGTTAFDTYKKAVLDIWDSFRKLLPEVKLNVSAFDVLAGTLKIVSIGFTSAIQFIKTIIQTYIDFIIVLKEAGKALFAVLQALVNPLKWGEAKAQMELVKTSFTNMTTNLLDNVDELVDGVVDGFKNFPDSAKDNSEKYKAIWNSALEDTKNQFEANNTDITTLDNDKNNTLIENGKTALAKQEDILEEWNKLQKKSIAEQIADVNKRKDAFIEAGIAEVEATRWAQDEIKQLWIDQATSTLNTITSVANQILSSYQSLFDSIMEIQNQELENLRLQNEAKTEELESQKNSELTSFDEKTQQMIEYINAQANADAFSKAKAAIIIKMIEEKRAKEKAELEKKLADKIAEQKKKALEEENAQEKKAFDANKANMIAQVWIQYASGVVGAWAQSIAQLGPIGGTIMAAVLTGILTAAAIAETIAISQQQFVPKKAIGGMASGPTMVNEMGGEIITLPDGSQVIPNDISRQIAAQSGKTNNNEINISFAGANISNKMDLEYVTSYVVNALGRKLRQQT